MVLSITADKKIPGYSDIDAAGTSSRIVLPRAEHYLEHLSRIY